MHVTTACIKIGTDLENVKHHVPPSMNVVLEHQLIFYFSNNPLNFYNYVTDNSYR